MKQYKTNLWLFIMFPIFITILLVAYLIIMFNRSYGFMNIINIGIDGIILIYYFVNFSYEVKMDSEWIVYRFLFRNYRMRKDELGFVVTSSFLTKFVCKNRNVYILTTAKGSLSMKELFKDFKKQNIK